MDDMVARDRKNVAVAGLIHPARPLVILAAAIAATLALILTNLGGTNIGWLHIFGPVGSLTPDDLVFRYSFLPRLAVSALSGAGLGITSFMFQKLLRNPLADPTSLGIAAGASLAMSIVSLWLPGLLVFGQEWVALGGGVVAFLFVMLIAGSTFSPIKLISAGLIISLICGSANAVLTIFNRDFLQNVFIWGSGSLNQNSWDIAYSLLPRVTVAMAVVCLFHRPLFLLSLGDDGARNLGVPVAFFRYAALFIAVGLSCAIISAVGIIGFAGMAAPILARLLGFRRSIDQMLVSGFAGALMLVMADQAAQLAGNLGRDIPTGAMTAVIGSPLLMILLPRLKGAKLVPGTDAGQDRSRSIRSPHFAFATLIIVFTAALVTAMFLGQNRHGWHWSSLAELLRYLPWYWPRAAAALCAGAMLGVAGVALQRVTCNPMASPEILGISSGASLGVILLAFLGSSDLASLPTFAAASAGAAVALAFLLAIGRRHAFSPDQTLLMGIAFGTAFGALSTILMASGDPRFGFLLAWMSGSTYGMTSGSAVFSAVAAAILLPTTIMLNRWIEILGLGEAVSIGVGVSIATARGVILLLACALTAVAILIMGPLSFVGLIGPHLATAIGLRRPVQQIFGAMMIGAIVMVAADWTGRNLMFPYEVPAGLLAALLGGPYFLFMHARRRG